MKSFHTIDGSHTDDLFELVPVVALELLIGLGQYPSVNVGEGEWGIVRVDIRWRRYVGHYQDASQQVLRDK